MNKRQKKKCEKLEKEAKEIRDYIPLCILTQAFKETGLLSDRVPTKQEIIDALLTSKTIINAGYAKYIILERR